MRPAFLRMRDSLAERGLIDAQFRLTEAGNAHVDDLIGRLKVAEPRPAPERRVFWIVDLRANAARASAARRRAA